MGRPRKVAAEKVPGPANNELQKHKELVTMLSTIISRRELQDRIAGTTFSGARDLYAVLGYNAAPVFLDYLSLYDRGDIATRIIDAPPNATWRRKPIIADDSDPDNFTEFETAWAQLVQKRRVFHYFERVDRLAGVGRYGLLLIGADDVRKEEDYARPMANLKKGINSIRYLIPFMEGNALIEEWDMDPMSERYSLPLMYLLDVTNAGTGQPDSAGQIGSSRAGLRVHWTRIIHVAEGLRENDYIGTPRLQHVINRLQDVEKIAGGSAEIFWQAAKRILVLAAKENFAAVDEDDALTEMMDELIHGLRRVIDVQGYDVKTLDPTDVKPKEAFDVAVALISSATGIPQRILFGSEQGKMASSQDETNWNGRIADRQLNFAEPVILRPFIDRLIQVRALPMPKGEYTVAWPSLFELSDKEKAQIGLLKSRTLAQYIGTNGLNVGVSETIVPLDEFRGELLNLRSKKIEHQKRSDPGQKDITGSGTSPSSAADQNSDSANA